MKSINVFAVLLMVIFLIGNPNINKAQSSNGWRGTNGDNKVEGFNVPAKWPEQLKNIWQVKVGQGDATPVMVDNKIFLHVMQDGNEVALCLNALDGKELWKTSLNPSPEITGPAIGHPGPRSTPFITGGKVFLLGAGGIVNCLDASSGKVIWKNDSYTEVPQFYTSSSPLVLNNLCILQLGGKDHGVVVAFDANSGKESWKLEGIPTTYATPSLMKTSENILLVQSDTDLCGVSTDGKLLWKIPCPVIQRFSNATSPVFEGQNVFVTGQGTGTKLFSITKQGETWNTKEIWTNAELGVSFSTPVLKDGFLYGHEAKRGELFCLNAKTGEKAWADATPHNRFASITDAGKVLVSLPATGNLIIIEPNGTKYVELAKYKVADTETYASPILSGNNVFVKDKEMLTCWSLK
jgi:outer membrane protein assembly factor BamB